MLVNKNLNRVAKEQEFVLISDSLQVFELSMVGILECLEELLIKLLKETDKRGNDSLFNIEGGVLKIFTTRNLVQ